MTTALAQLTIVIPVGPDDVLSPVLQAQLQRGLPPETKIHVVCARESDHTRLRVPNAPDGPWRFLLASPGRAAQQNAGARDACTAYLWFLHADSQLDKATLPALAKFIERGESALGYFDLRFLRDGPGWVRLNAVGAWLRSRWFGLPFGDQGFVLPRIDFQALAGFDTRLSTGEDHDLVWRVRRAGLPLRPLHAALYTSARKYAERGWWRTTRHHVTATWRQARMFSRARTSQTRQMP